MEKWMKFLILIVSLTFLFSGCAIFKNKKTLAEKDAAKIQVATVAADVSETGRYTLGDAPVGEGTFYITVEVPLLQNIADPKWQLSASWAWNDGGKWILVPLDNYSVRTESKGETLVAYIPVPGGIEKYWPRIWGQELKSKEWLRPDGGVFCREGITKGHLAYEFLVNTRTGEKKTVPSDYQKRP